MAAAIVGVLAVGFASFVRWSLQTLTYHDARELLKQEVETAVQHAVGQAKDSLRVYQCMHTKSLPNGSGGTDYVYEDLYSPLLVIPAEHAPKPGLTLCSASSLLYLKRERQVDLTVGGNPRRFSTYRFVYTYLHLETSRTKPDGTPVEHVYEARSGLYADYAQIRGVADLGQRALVIADLLAQGVERAYDKGEHRFEDSFYDLGPGSDLVLSDGHVTMSTVRPLTRSTGGRLGTGLVAHVSKFNISTSAGSEQGTRRIYVNLKMQVVRPVLKTPVLHSRSDSVTVSENW